MKKYPHIRLLCSSFILCLLSTCFFIPGFSQENSSKKQQKVPQGFDPDRLVFGGNLGFQFGDVTLIDVSPLIGYQFTDRIMAGVGISYQYYDDTRFTPKFSTSIYGGRVFGRYYFIDNFFAHAEYEMLNYDAGFIDPMGFFNTRRVTANNMYVGGGLVLPIAGKAGFNIMILYNLNENSESLYSNPVYRIGFTMGI